MALPLTTHPQPPPQGMGLCVAGLFGCRFALYMIRRCAAELLARNGGDFIKLGKRQSRAELVAVYKPFVKSLN